MKAVLSAVVLMACTGTSYAQSEVDAAVMFLLGEVDAKNVAGSMTMNVSTFDDNVESGLFSGGFDKFGCIYSVAASYSVYPGGDLYKSESIWTRNVQVDFGKALDAFEIVGRQKDGSLKIRIEGKRGFACSDGKCEDHFDWQIMPASKLVFTGSGEGRMSTLDDDDYRRIGDRAKKAFVFFQQNFCPASPF